MFEQVYWSMMASKIIGLFHFNSNINEKKMLYTLRILWDTSVQCCVDAISHADGVPSVLFTQQILNKVYLWSKLIKSKNNRWTGLFGW